MCVCILYCTERLIGPFGGIVSKIKCILLFLLIFHSYEAGMRLVSGYLTLSVALQRWHHYWRYYFYYYYWLWNFACPHIRPCNMWDCHTPVRHMAAIGMRSIIILNHLWWSCVLFTLQQQALKGRRWDVWCCLQFSCLLKERENMEMSSQVWEKLMSRVDEWWLLVYVNPHVLFYNINTDVSHLQWYMVCLIVFCPN